MNTVLRSIITIKKRLHPLRIERPFWILKMSCGYEHYGIRVHNVFTPGDEYKLHYATMPTDDVIMCYKKKRHANF